MWNTCRKSAFVLLIGAGICLAFIEAIRFIARPGIVSGTMIYEKSKGVPGAEIHIIEYVDFRCGPCASGSLWLNDILEMYPHKFYLELRYFPLNLSYDLLDVRFAECALRQGKFWDAVEALMVDQTEWVRHDQPKLYFLDLAVHLGLNIKNLTVCWDDPRLYDEILANKRSVRQEGVNATPTYIINDIKVIGFSNMKAEIEALLESDNE
jgi:protein-disulfide isomerase